MTKILLSAASIVVIVGGLVALYDRHQANVEAADRDMTRAVCDFARHATSPLFRESCLKRGGQP